MSNIIQLKIENIFFNTDKILKDPSKFDPLYFVKWIEMVATKQVELEVLAIKLKNIDMRIRENAIKLSSSIWRLGVK